MAAEYIVKPRNVLRNPNFERLRKMVAEMPNARLTEFGNYNVATKVTARSKDSTFVVQETPIEGGAKTMSRSKFEQMALLQDAYITEQDMIVIDGFIGADAETRTAVRLYVEKKNANIAAMQKQLYFAPTTAELETFVPELNVIYTPNLKAEGFPKDRLIAVDLDHYVTRVFNSDYFGESKKGGLRMWNKLIFERGGLALHAGCKSIPVGDSRKICLIIGLSGTGKTTTTFSRQNGSLPIQDDFIAWLKDGSVIGSENGCFAKTFGLDAESEPMIHHAVTQPGAFLENVSVKEDGRVDFFDDSYTQNGRATFPLSMIPEHGDVRGIKSADFILILNRNEDIIPAVARLKEEQAAGYFMLGETKGTSAGGVEEAGKALRVPGTNPFFPMHDKLQGQRFLELLKKSHAQAFLMNTGWVGGPEGTPHSRKVKIHHSSAVVQGIADGNIQWTEDEDFGYELAKSVPSINPEDEVLLHPKAYYKDTERESDYEALVARLKAQRSEYLERYNGLKNLARSVA